MEQARDGNKASARAARWLIVVVGTLAAATCLALYWWPTPKLLLGDEARYLEYGIALAQGGQLQPELLWPPLQNALVASAASLQSEPLLIIGLVQSVQCVCWLACLLIWHDLSLRWLGARAALIVGLLIAAHLPLAAYVSYLWPEMTHLLLWSAAIWLLERRASQSITAAIGAGALLGLGLLAKSVFGPMLPVFALYLLARRGWRAGWVPTAALLITAVAVTVPVRQLNLEHHGQWVVGNAGAFNVALGLADRSPRNFADSIAGQFYRDYLASADNYAERDRLLWQHSHEQLRDRGLGQVLTDQLTTQYFRLFDQDSFLSIQLPGSPVLARPHYAQTPLALAELVRWLSYTTLAALLIMLPFGLMKLGQTRTPALWLLATLVAYQLTLFLVLHVKTRYLMQMWPALAVLAAAACQPAPQARPWQWVVSTLVAIVLLLLAFGPR